MRRFIKLLIVLVFIGAAVATVSYAGAFMKMKDYLGSNLPELGARETSFVPRVEGLPNRPMAWKFEYKGTAMRELQSIAVFVSPTGEIIGTVPPNLKARLEPHRRRIP